MRKDWNRWKSNIKSDVWWLFFLALARRWIDWSFCASSFWILNSSTLTFQRLLIAWIIIFIRSFFWDDVLCTWWWWWSLLIFREFVIRFIDRINPFACIKGYIERWKWLRYSRTHSSSWWRIDIGRRGSGRSNVRIHWSIFWRSRIISWRSRKNDKWFHTLDRRTFMSDHAEKTRNINVIN